MTVSDTHEVNEHLLAHFWPKRVWCGNLWFCVVWLVKLLSRATRGSTSQCPKAPWKGFDSTNVCRQQPCWWQSKPILMDRLCHLSQPWQIDWTSVFSAKFFALKQDIKNLQGIRYKLWVMGVSIKGPSYIYGNTMCLFTNASIKDLRIITICLLVSPKHN
jgi:hypothetical protein